MPEMADTGKYHGYAMFIGRGDDLIITHGATGLDHSADSGLGGGIDTIPEWKECV